jgi:hypothetical protein
MKKLTLLTLTFFLSGCLEKELIPERDHARTDSALVVMTMEGKFKSIHDVPEEALKKMFWRYAYDISQLWEEYPELYK